MPEIDKEASRAWHRRLREVLNRDWDPIGVAHKSEGEYDGYAAKIAVMLRENASDEELLAYLEWAELEHMGLGRSDQNRNLDVIAKLRGLGAQP